jgi:hypothetical protein
MMDPQNNGLYKEVKVASGLTISIMCPCPNLKSPWSDNEEAQKKYKKCKIHTFTTKM